MYLVMQDGRSFLLQGGTSAIGRSLDNKIVLTDTPVSRRHAEIRWDASGVYLRDVGSANGTKVDGLRLQPGQWRVIYPGMQVVLGDEVRCQVMASLPASAQAPGAPVVMSGAAQPEPPRVAAPISELEPAARARPPSAREGLFSQAGRGLDLLLRAVDVSLDQRKLLVTLGGTAFAGLAAFLAFLIANSVQRESPPLFVLFVAVGAILIWLIMSFTFGAVTKMSFADLTGRSPVTPREAVAYALRRGADFALTPLALLMVVAAVVLVEVIILLIGRVPYAGEVIASVLFVPALVLNLFLVAVLTFGPSLVYPIIVDRGRGVGGTLVRALVVIRHAPARIAFYLGIAGLLTAVATGVLWSLLSGALLLTLQALWAGLGVAKFSAIGLSGVGDMLPMFGGMLGGLYGNMSANSFTYVLARYLIEVGVLVALALALAFPLVLQISLACAVYLQVRDDVSDGAGLLR